MVPRLIISLIVFAPVIRAQSLDAANELFFVPTIGMSIGQAGGDPLIGAFLTLGFQTRHFDLRVAGEAAALPGACGTDYLNNCGDSNGAYFDPSIARRLGVSGDSKRAWQVGIGPSAGPRRAWFVSPYVEWQADAGAAIARFGARYRHGVSGDRQWYDGTQPRIASVYFAIGFADDGR